MRSDPRIDLAKAMPMREVVDRLPLDGLRRVSRELVGPCPVCGGRDRFNINIDRGVFLCRQCGGKGDGIDLAMFVLGCDFKAALDHLAGSEVDIDPAELARRKEKARAARAKQEAAAAAYRARAIRDAVTIWKDSRPAAASPVVDYLAARGIRLPALPKSIRFKQDHPYVVIRDKRPITLHRGPCMIAAIQGPDDRLAAVHQTWIDLARPDGKAAIFDPETGKGVPAKLVRGAKKAGAIRLGGAHSHKLIMGEGIETTLSARMTPSAGPAIFWAGVDLGNFSGLMLDRNSGEPDLTDERAFVPPPWVRHLVLIQDGDSDPDTTRAKLLACIKRAQSKIPGLMAEIAHPGPGLDLNDLLRGSAPAARQDEERGEGN